MNWSPCRRRFLLLAVGILGLGAGCTRQSPLSSDLGGTPSPTRPPTVSRSPDELVLEPTQLPQTADLRWNKSGTRPVDDGLSVNYEVHEDGEYSHQVTASLIRRPTVDGAVFDHDKLVEIYSEEHDATVEELSFGDTGSLVTFTGEAHAIVTYRNLVVHVTSYGGPSEQAVEVARRQIMSLEQQAPRTETRS